MADYLFIDLATVLATHRRVADAGVRDLALIEARLKEAEEVDYNALWKRLEALPEVQFSAYMTYLGFQLPPTKARRPLYTDAGMLYVKIGRLRNDKEVTVTWYPDVESGPGGQYTAPGLEGFPSFDELLLAGLPLPEEFFREAWEKVYRVVTGAGIGHEELHTDTSGYDEAKKKSAVQKAYFACWLANKRDPAKEAFMLKTVAAASPPGKISSDVEFLVSYARNVIKGRWPEAEPLILRWSRAAILYAEYPLGERWPELEEKLVADWPPEELKRAEEFNNEKYIDPVWYAERVMHLPTEKAIKGVYSPNFREVGFDFDYAPHEELHTDIGGYDESRLIGWEGNKWIATRVDEFRLGDRVRFTHPGTYDFNREGEVTAIPLVITLDNGRVLHYSHNPPQQEISVEVLKPPEHEELHTDVSGYDESVLSENLGNEIDLSGVTLEEFSAAIESFKSKHPTEAEASVATSDWQDLRFVWTSPGYYSSYPQASAAGSFTLGLEWNKHWGIASNNYTGGAFEITLNTPRAKLREWFTDRSLPEDLKAHFLDWAARHPNTGGIAYQQTNQIKRVTRKIWEAAQAVWEKILASLKPVEHYELHTDTSGYDEAIEKDKNIEEALGGLYTGPEFEKERWQSTILSLREELRHELTIREDTEGLSRTVMGLTEEDSGVAFNRGSSNGHQLVQITVRTDLISPGMSVHLYGDEIKSGAEVPQNIEALLDFHDTYYLGGPNEKQRSMGRPEAGDRDLFLEALRKDAEYPTLVRFYEEFVFRLFNAVPEHEELHTDISGYDESILSRLREAKEVIIDSSALETAISWARETFRHSLIFDHGPRRSITFFFNYAEDMYTTLKTKPSASLKFQFGKLGNGEEYLGSINTSYISPKAYSGGPLELAIVDIVEGYPIPNNWSELETEILHKYGKAESRFLAKIRRLKFFPRIETAFEGFIERLFAPVAHEELHTDTSGYDESTSYGRIPRDAIPGLRESHPTDESPGGATV